MSVSSETRHQRLLGFLARDPDNLDLVADAATAAFEAGDLASANQLIDRYGAAAPLDPALRNLSGLVALAEGRFGEAAGHFEALRASVGDDPALRFNLAWSRAMLGDWQAAAELTDDDAVIATAPRAAALRVQALHHLGRPADALAAGEGLAARAPRDAELMSALAVAAIDAEETDLARTYAERAGDTHEGLSTLGMLTLGEHRPDDALGYFDRALKANPESGRALLGKGLGLLAAGDATAAAAYLDKGAALFHDHLGSWVAAGWAYFAAGDLAGSRTRFATALALDDTFAETHGGLAVLDIVEGRIDEGRRRTEIALRLDSRCFAGVLAKSLLLERDGDAAAADRLRHIALNAPVGPSGATLGQAIAALARPRGR